MNESPSDRDLLIETNTTVKNMKQELLGGDGRVGIIQVIQYTIRDHAKDDTDRFDKQAEILNKQNDQLNFWRGGLALLALLFLALGSAFLMHVLGGK